MNNLKGTFLLVFDVELAWGFMTMFKIDEWRLRAVGKVRQVLGSVLRLVNDYEISATWALVGHLFLDKCERNGRPHADMPRPNYAWSEDDWFKHDPCTNITKDPLWYGKDIVKEILDFSKKCSAEQEIASHSFSHPVFGDPGCSTEFAQAEIDKCLKIMDSYGLRPKTFVFPLGLAGHIGLLREKGFTAFFSGVPQRIKGSSLGRAAPSVFQKYVSSGIDFWAHNAVLPPPIFTPREALPELWDFSGSICFNKKKGVPMSFVVLRAKEGIKRAIREKKCFYMYTHCHNFGVDSDSVINGFEDVLRYVFERRKSGKLDVQTVQGLVATLKD